MFSSVPAAERKKKKKKMRMCGTGPFTLPLDTVVPWLSKS
jgi:hypothetical protein